MSATTPSSSASRPLEGGVLQLARAVWLVLVAVQLASFLSGIPHYLPLVEHQCQQGCLLTISQAESLARAGIPLIGFVVAALAASILSVVAATIMAVILFARRSHDLMVLIAAYVIVILPTSVALMPGPTVSTVIQTTAFILPPAADVLINAILSGAILGLFLLFPSGRFVPRWSWALLASFVPFTTMFIVWPQFETPLTPVWLLFFGTAAGCIGYRYWRVSTPVERQQTKWVSLGFVIFMAIISAYWIPLYAFPDATLYQPLAYLAYQLILPIVPLSFFIAIQRYRLYDIDTIIRRTLVYGSLTAILVAIYVVGVVGAQALVSRIVGPSAEQEPILIVVTTLLVAALFQPLRRRLQHLIDRSFYRTRYDAARMLAIFGATLRNEVELNALTDHLIGTVEDAMRPAHVSLWLRMPEEP